MEEKAKKRFREPSNEENAIMGIKNKKERNGFLAMREALQEVADELGCGLKINRHQRSRAITMELIPSGSPYGPRVRMADADLKSGFYDRATVEKTAANLKDRIKGHKELMKDWE